MSWRSSGSALVLQVPDWATLDGAAAAIAVGAAVAPLRFHAGMLRLIAVCAAWGWSGA